MREESGCDDQEEYIQTKSVGMINARQQPENVP
jgi:hypothetical protein